MVIKLMRDKAMILPMKYPEAFEHTFIEFIFELGTNHLIPVLYIEDYRVLDGNNAFVDMSKALRHVNANTKCKVKVLLKDVENNILHKYEGTFPFYNYFILGTKPARIDFEVYIKSLEDEIRKLKEQGDLI